MSSERNFLQQERLQNDVDCTANLNCALPSEKIDCFSTLPAEIFVKVCKRLDLLSLFKCGGVNRYWYAITRDPTIVCNISEQYEYKKQILIFETLTQRRNRVKKFEYKFYNFGLHCEDNCVSRSYKSQISLFCSDRSKIMDDNLTKTLFKFFEHYCHELTHLKLSSDLNYFNYYNLDCCLRRYNLLNLRKLKSLDLSRQTLKEENLIELLNCNPNLECLKIENCSGVSSLDSLLATIGRSNKKMSCFHFYPGISIGQARFYPLGCEVLLDKRRGRGYEELPIKYLSLKKLNITVMEFPVYKKLLNVLYNSTNLTNLTLIYEPDFEIELFGRPFSDRLKNKSIDFCEKVFKTLPKLQELELSATLIPASEIELNSLKELYPKLRIIMEEDLW